MRLDEKCDGEPGRSLGSPSGATAASAAVNWSKYTATDATAPPPRYDNSDRRDAVHQVMNQGQDGRINPANAGRNDYREHHQSYCVFTTEQQDKQSVQRRHMEVNAVVPAVPRYQPWSDQEVIWSMKDHPRIMPSPGSYALVLDPTFVGPSINVKFSKVLIDNGSSINIMYKDTMHKLGISQNMLQSTRTTFHGIV